MIIRVLVKRTNPIPYTPRTVFARVFVAIPTDMGECNQIYWYERIIMEKISSIFIGNIYGHKDAYAGAVFSVQGLCPAIKANSGGNTQPMIVMRDVVGDIVRNNDNNKTTN